MTDEGEPTSRADAALIPTYHSPMLDVAYKLNANEAPEAPPPAFLELLAAELASLQFNRYPDREAHALREALADFHHVDAAQVYCANGSNEVLQSLLLAYGGPGRIAVTFEPTYTMHGHIAKITGTTVLSGERDEELLIGTDELERVLGEAAAGDPRAPSITFLCSPNNPTGCLEPDETIQMVLERAPGLVVVDEAYGQFAPRSALERLDRYPRLVVVRTFSKTWSLAGLRLGYAIASPSVVSALEAVTLPYHLDTFKQVAGRLALRFVDEMTARVERLVSERRRVVAGLEGLGLFVCPSEANFVLFRTGPRDATEVWSALVDEASVLVRDVSSWPRLAGYLRVTIGTAEENDAFLAALAKVLG